ncbi:cob(I)yrinic acid a,c-diamide adenosyltransferase [Shewanella eurypsychrophilus]|uniref:Corrinoid adenosyltransferase n=2 Tax=Shewanellaceae TaxID=267890 RepID=A0ABX6V9V2_9GAMM|nr:cob(I)yrinic acid a,c-diamide adenosyltransferase [Shewanella sp. YLB-09]QPG59464.1 cob(I)yrinic acid a,c-diamide adenosyltransferase [Shewanella eurypsychrophilus]
MTNNNESSNSIEDEKKMSPEERKAERHKARQQRVKETVDAKIAAAQEEKGILLVLTGNGKGKSTSGFGTIARSVGHGKKAAVVQFIKGNWECGERTLLEGAGVDFHVMGTGFTWETQDREKDTQAAESAWEAAEVLLKDESIDCLMLDELTYMVSYHYLDVERVITALKNRPKMQHVIVTGRACHRAIIELADTVSEVQSLKHAFDNGIKAQPGFDY